MFYEVEGDAQHGGLPGAVGPQQGGDLASVEGEGQVSHGRLVGLVLLGHRHQGDARGAFLLRLLPGWRGQAWRETDAPERPSNRAVRPSSPRKHEIAQALPSPQSRGEGQGGRTQVTSLATKVGALALPVS